MERPAEPYLSVADNQFCIRSENKLMKFDKEKFEELKNLYAKANSSGVDRFEMEGQVLLVSYAKYLIEYLSPFFGNVEIEKK